MSDGASAPTYADALAGLAGFQILPTRFDSLGVCLWRTERIGG